MQRERFGWPQASPPRGAAVRGAPESIPALCATLLAQDRIIERETHHILGSRLAFDILLDIYLAEHRGTTPCLWDIGSATPLPSTTAHRRLTAMLDRGLLIRLPATGDRRRVTVQLGPDAKALVERTLQLLVEQGA